LPFFPIPNRQDFIEDVHKGSYVPSSLLINIGGKRFSQSWFNNQKQKRKKCSLTLKKQEKERCGNF